MDNSKGAREKAGKLFGTDGIRGTPGKYPLTDDMIFRIGCGAAEMLLRRGRDKSPLRVVIGKDTRLSGQRIETVLADALHSFGAEILLSGVIPTPGLSFLVRKMKADIGIMISASHNKATDNGLKFFNGQGHKLSVEEEEFMERIVLDGTADSGEEEPPAGVTGKVINCKQAIGDYIDFLVATVEGVEMNGLRVVLDCASGASSVIARDLFARLGTEVYSINDTGDGSDINTGGALNPQVLSGLVRERQADIGFAFDGDGDRVILVDEKGCILDGDYILAIAGHYFFKKNKLSQRKVVSTVMSNYGLKQAMDNLGADLIYAQVGDKYVLEALVSQELNLGGEQSGHIIFRDYSPAPDGLLVAIQILKIMKETGKSLNELSKVMFKYPQILVNVKVKEKKPFESLPLVKEAVSRYNAKLKDKGRLLLRYSGTEPLARIMVEGEDEALIRDIAGSLTRLVEAEIGMEGVKNNVEA